MSEVLPSRAGDIGVMSKIKELKSSSVENVSEANGADIIVVITASTKYGHHVIIKHQCRTNIKHNISMPAITLGAQTKNEVSVFLASVKEMYTCCKPIRKDSTITNTEYKYVPSPVPWFLFSC